MKIFLQNSIIDGIIVGIVPPPTTNSTPPRASSSAPSERRFSLNDDSTISLPLLLGKIVNASSNEARLNSLYTLRQIAAPEQGSDQQIVVGLEVLPVLFHLLSSAKGEKNVMLELLEIILDLLTPTDDREESDHVHGEEMTDKYGFAANTALIAFLFSG